MSPSHDPISESDFQAYLDGRLDDARMAEVETYLDRHPETAQKIAGWRANDTALSDLLAPYAYAGADDIPAKTHASNWNRAGLIAAMLVITFGLGGGAGYLIRDWSQPAVSASEPVNWLEAAARDVYLTYVREVRHPVEVGPDEREHLVSWLGNRIEKPFTAPSLADLGFSLVGGRLLPLNGQPGAMLMYENAQGDRATILMARNSGDRDTAFQYSQDDGVNTFRWVEGPLAYAISGFIGRGDLESISRAVYDHFEAI